MDTLSEPLPDLKFAKLPYPHLDFALVSAKPELFEDLADRLGLICSGAGSLQEHAVLSSRPGKDLGDETVYFSGSTRTEDRFIFGEEDLNHADLDEISDQVGDYTLLRVGKNITATTDFFGVGKFYRYDDGNFFAISNRYHLLILCIKQLNRPIKLNVKKLRATLTAANQPFVQNFSREMSVVGIECLLAGTRVVVKEKSIVYEEAGLLELLRCGETTVQDYPTSVRLAAEEIIDNLRVALESKRFEYVRVDVTAGLDARMVVGALSHFPQYRDRIRLHTADVINSPRDLEVSLALSEIIGFEYDDIARTYTRCLLEDSLIDLISLDLDTYFGRRPVSVQAKLNDSLRISGFYGEICARPYYARLLFGNWKPSQNLGKLVERIVKGIPKTHRMSELDHDLHAILTEELSRLPGSSDLEKWDLHYLFYRNGLHCSDKWLNQTIGPSWGPLQSKEMFKLKLKMFDDESIKLQLDVTAALNPEAARYPYGRPRDNDEREKLQSRLERADLDFITGDLCVDRTKYDESKRVANGKITRVPHPEPDRITNKNKNFPAKFKAFTLAALERLIDTGLIEESSQGRELRSLVADIDEQAPMQVANVVICNKIIHAAYLVDYASPYLAAPLPRPH
ncbi:hypothetical protein [Nitratireductor sp. GZWM139]|uniref:hypothetical protein n=1 Tax=Nitratireductor sp. GZWM139 TaxID=2950541 RepID=UPI0024BD80BC|nr:hypothetical protein [Nitratireductor sp. GZWM139]MDJ1465805.1 hypothetical protein [Nitratireductor sp. GZWM139]